MRLSLKNKKLVLALKVVLFVLFISFLANLLLSKLLQERLGEYVSSIGIFGPIILILYVVLSHVLAPLAGAPAVIIGYSVFGIYKTSIYFYIASMISATINFYIARMFGRRWVLRFIGKKSMKEIDTYTDNFGTQILIFARVFGFTFFELISYAAGFTNISYKKYILITSTFVIIPSLVLVYFFKDANFYNLAAPALWIGAMIVAGVLFAILMKLIVNKKSK